MEFISAQASSTDIFCLQEISYIAPHHLDQADKSFGDAFFHDLVAALPEFKPYFVATHERFNWRPVTTDMSFGNAIFVKKTLRVVEDGHVFVHRVKNDYILSELVEKNWYTLPRLVQYVRIADENGVETTIYNFHGLWHKEGKGDIPARIEQAKKIRELLDATKGRKILCGDFNLDIRNESLTTIEGSMRNLIKEFGIQTTRSKTHYSKIDRMPYADYTLVSSDIEVQNFSVPNLSISDHLPMILEFV